MTTAFVLSGGASLGAVQVGMMQALGERGIVPDLVIGTSVGAINGAFVCGRPGSDGLLALAKIWRGLRRQDVFPIGPLQGALGYYGMRNWLVRPGALERLVRDHVAFADLSDAVIPFHAVATDIVSGMEVLLSRGPTAQVVLASAAIPGIFPPVELEGRQLMDGGVANNTPLHHAVGLGADTVYVLPAGYACALAKPPQSALGLALHALTLLIGRGLSADVERNASICQLHVVPPLCPLDVSPADFSRAQELIQRGYETTRMWLDANDTTTPDAQAASVGPHLHAM